MEVYFTEFNISSYGMPSSSSSSETSRDFPKAYRSKQERNVSEERAKWGDRGVTIGHMYDPLSSSKAAGPVWLERGLNDSRDSGDESVL